MGKGHLYRRSETITHGGELRATPEGADDRDNPTDGGDIYRRARFQFVPTARNVKPRLNQIRLPHFGCPLDVLRGHTFHDLVVTR